MGNAKKQKKQATKAKAKPAGKVKAKKTSAPSYLGLLNAIAVGETGAELFLLGWADTTTDTQLAETLRFVAMREGEHGKAFAKRMLELGYPVRWPAPAACEAKLAMACSSMTDAEKFAAFKLGRKPGGPDVFDRMFEDKTLDVATGALLGRYIAEERDSGRRLYKARRRVEA